MRDSSVIVKERQSAIRRELDRRGVSLKAISFDSNVPYSTLLSYFPEEGGRDPAMMPVSVLFRLIGIIPNDVLSLLLPSAHVIMRVPEGLDHDDVEDAARDFLAVKGKAHHPESPGGRELADCEQADLDKLASRLRAVS